MRRADGWKVQGFNREMRSGNHEAVHVLHLRLLVVQRLPLLRLASVVVRRRLHRRAVHHDEIHGHDHGLSEMVVLPGGRMEARRGRRSAHGHGDGSLSVLRGPGRCDLRLGTRLARRRRETWGKVTAGKGAHRGDGRGGRRVSVRENRSGCAEALR